MVAWKEVIPRHAHVMNRLKIAVLDDYLHLSQKSADWSKRGRFVLQRLLVVGLITRAAVAIIAAARPAPRA